MGWSKILNWDNHVLDEDGMSSDSAVKIPTQQSVKAYVDDELLGFSTTTTLAALEDTTISGTPTDNSFLFYHDVIEKWTHRTAGGDITGEDAGDSTNVTITIVDGAVSGNKIATSGVALSKLEDVADNTILMNDSGTTGAPSAINVGHWGTKLKEAPGDDNEIRNDLGLSIGSHVQAHHAHLDTIAALTDTIGKFIVGSAVGWTVEDGGTARTSLGLGTGNSPTFTTVTATGNVEAAGALTGASATINGVLIGTVPATITAASNTNINLDPKGTAIVDLQGDVTIQGNLTVVGDSTSTGHSSLDVSDASITYGTAGDATNLAAAQGNNSITFSAGVVDAGGGTTADSVDMKFQGGKMVFDYDGAYACLDDTTFTGTGTLDIVKSVGMFSTGFIPSASTTAPAFTDLNTVAIQGDILAGMRVGMLQLDSSSFDNYADAAVANHSEAVSNVSGSILWNGTDLYINV